AARHARRRARSRGPRVPPRARARRGRPRRRAAVRVRRRRTRAAADAALDAPLIAAPPRRELRRTAARAAGSPRRYLSGRPSFFSFGAIITRQYPWPGFWRK